MDSLCTRTTLLNYSVDIIPPKVILGRGTVTKLLRLWQNAYTLSGVKSFVEHISKSISECFTSLPETLLNANANCRNHTYRILLGAV